MAGFVWYELMTSDPEAAERFYRSVVGWSAQAGGGGGASYSVMRAESGPAAGIMALPEEARAAGGRPGWLGYVAVEDVDEASERVRAAGGSVHRAPADIPDIGRFSVVADPQGANFMLFKPAGSGEMRAQTAPGRVGWHELYTTDWERAFAFYAGQFGWTKDQAIDMGPMGTYQLFAAGGPAIGGMMNKPPQVPVPMWQFYFNVPELDAAAARVAEGGGQVLMGPLEVPGGGWIIQGMDPQGAVFALVAPRR